MMGSNTTTANTAAIGAALGAILVWALALVVPPAAMETFPQDSAIVAVTWLFCRLMPPPSEITAKLAGTSVLPAILLVGAGTLLSGCALTYTTPAGATVGAYTGLAPGDELQTLDATVIGISVDATRQSLDIGYKKLRMTRIPTYEEPAVVPSVLFTTTVDDSSITDKLSVGEAP